jgi:hypothetical protein
MELLSGLSFALATAPLTVYQEQTTDGSQVYCPICVANGYASGIRSKKEWFLSANSSGGALWFGGLKRIQLGATYHQASKSVRGLLAYQVLEETAGTPGLNFSYGVQSQETGRTGTSITLEKNFAKGASSLNLFGGVAYRTSENFGRAVAGFKYSPNDVYFIGNQFDGVDHNPFFQIVKGDRSVGLLYVGSKKLSLTVGLTF